ncbi:helix-turn-helix domain-containing protein [Streptomyces sp. NA04227]|uniref:helix-turn-helix domain-containing protein n=1 Tax=Streptomyces sp. NA04227 TaxID=2742136 RepID=UPI00158FE7EB|nr:helix-turn-helix domain-containing protein [Streptomyces sp. NA04227]QKW09172.1 helix-turn-helix domain-containing protein [Streptomyces sp. NA04227]
MAETASRGDDISCAEWFDTWRQVALHGICPAELHTERPGSFDAQDRAVSLGSIEVTSTSAGGLQVCRTPRLIRRSDPEMWVIHAPLRGEFSVDLGRHQIRHGPGTVMVISTSLPYTLSANSDYAGVKAYLPRGLLPVPESVVRRTLSTPLTGGAGFGSLLTHFLRDVAAPGPGHRPDDAARLGTVLLDLSAALLASCGDAERSLPAENRRGALFLRAQDFVRRNLADPGLAPATVAASLGISSRLLQQIFREQGLGVAGWIREQRLERCRRELADPARAGVTVREIAARWCFGQPAAFTRAFRRAFGTAPAEYRAMALSHALREPPRSPGPGTGLGAGLGAAPGTGLGTAQLPLAPRRLAPT